MDFITDIGAWQALAAKIFPGLEAGGEPSCADPHSLCEDLAYAADEAHRTRANREFLSRCYRFVRWSIHNSADRRINGAIADRFFARVLSLPFSKTGCLDYLDWGDVEALCAAFTVEPSFEDTSNFQRLCGEWRRRWARNRKLPRPRFPDERHGFVAAPSRPGGVRREAP